MKTTIIFTLMIFIGTATLAQTGAYHKAMAQAMQASAQAESPEQLANTVNLFERIATLNPDSLWPHYYTALAMVNQSWQLGSAAAKDALLDLALVRVGHIEELYPNNSEVITLKGYALMAKMVVDPQSRGRNYSPQIMAAYSKAMALDPANPRAYAMTARMELGSAQFFGTGNEAACAKAKKSLVLFDSEDPQGFEPRWGRSVAEEVLQTCEGDKK